jgi:hypothetical protein
LGVDADRAINIGIELHSLDGVLGQRACSEPSARARVRNDYSELHEIVRAFY